MDLWDTFNIKRIQGHVGVFRKGYKIEDGMIRIKGVFPNPDDLLPDGEDSYWGTFSRYFEEVVPFAYYIPHKDRGKDSLHLRLSRLDIENQEEILEFVNTYGLLSEVHTSQPLKAFQNEVKLFRFFLNLLEAYNAKQAVSALNLIADHRQLISETLSAKDKSKLKGILPVERPANDKEAKARKIAVPFLLMILFKRGFGTVEIRLMFSKSWNPAVEAGWFIRSLLSACYVMVWLDYQQGWAGKRCPICGEYFLSKRKGAKYKKQYCDRDTCGKKAARTAFKHREKIKVLSLKHGNNSSEYQQAIAQFEAWKKEVGFVEQKQANRERQVNNGNG